MPANRRRGVPRAVRVQVLARDQYTCQICGATAPDAKLEVDHKFPQSQGGPDTLDNLGTLCATCNGGKSDSWFGDYMNPGYGQPTYPRDIPMFRVNAGAGTWRGWERWSPQWMVSHVYGADPGFVDVRYRSCVGVTDWETRYTDQLASRPFQAVFDFSKGPTRDDHQLKAHDVGVEIRCKIGRGYRHEMHIFPLVRKDHPNKTHMEHHLPIVPATIWFTKFPV